MAKPTPDADPEIRAVEPALKTDMVLVVGNVPTESSKWARPVDLLLIELSGCVRLDGRPLNPTCRVIQKQSCHISSN